MRPSTPSYSTIRLVAKHSFTTPFAANQDDDDKVQWQTLWPVMRSILTVWAMGVWALLILLPGLEQVEDLSSAALHVPYILIGLALVIAVVASYHRKADGHLLWFLTVLLLLAGWM